MGPSPRPLRGLIVAAAFAASAIVTALGCRAMAGGMPMPGDWMMSMAWMRMPGGSWLGAGAMFVAMWAAMMIAMMLPSLAPVMLRHRRPVRVAAAYFGVWALAGIAVYPVGVAIATIAMASPTLSRAVPIATGLVIVAAGLVQLTRWKRRELARCRDRSCCARGRTPGPRQAWRDGLRLGRHCIRCCAPAMAILIVGGVMEPGVMAAVTAAITAERFAPRVAPLLGWLAIAVGVLVAI